MIDKFGADVLRLWVASTEYEGEMRISQEIINRTTDSYRRIRNTVRFLIGNLNDFDAADSLEWHQMLELDQWAVRYAQQLHQEIIEAYDAYRFHLVCQKIHRFCIVQMGGFYLDILKDRLYTMPADSRGRRSAQTAMVHILEAIVRWLAPVLSFTAEEIWQILPNRSTKSVFLTGWYEDWPKQAKDENSVNLQAGSCHAVGKK